MTLATDKLQNVVSFSDLLVIIVYKNILNFALNITIKI